MSAELLNEFDLRLSPQGLFFETGAGDDYQQLQAGWEAIENLAMKTSPPEDAYEFLENMEALTCRLRLALEERDRAAVVEKEATKEHQTAMDSIAERLGREPSLDELNEHLKYKDGKAYWKGEQL